MADSPGNVDDRIAPDAESQDAVLRLHAERLEIARRIRPLGVVRVSTVTDLREIEVSEELAAERIDIVRVPVNRNVETCPPVRVEGDTTIVSVVEEVVVIERRLVLTEEVHITRVRTTSVHHETVSLREQHAVIVREPPE